MVENVIRIKGEKHNTFEKDYIWNPATCSCENDIIDDSVIMCDEVLKSYNEETKTVPTTFNERSTL